MGTLPGLPMLDRETRSITARRLRRSSCPAIRAAARWCLLSTDSGLTYPVFIDSYSARVLGSLTAAEWLPGWSRALHGGWPLGAAGSWLLELADGWAIFMIASGLYLWWPRGRGFLAALWPRVHHGRRVLMRDLHASVAVLFSIVFLFFLVSALPWTSFWGGEVLSRVQTLLGQQGSAGFSPGGASTSRMNEVLQPIDTIVAEARARGLGPGISIRLAPWPKAPLYPDEPRQSAGGRPGAAGRPRTGTVIMEARRTDEPAIPRVVGFGVHVHQGDFGAWNVWLNTAFALSLVWLTVTGTASWLMRRPGRGWGVPPKVHLRWPRSPGRRCRRDVRGAADFRGVRAASPRSRVLAAGPTYRSASP